MGRKLAVTEFLSLDGVMEAPQVWSGSYGNEESGKYKLDEVFATDALLLGRVTYEGFAEAWPGRTDEQGFADRFNSIPKYVATTTLKDLKWNNSTRLEGDLAAAVSELKEEPGGDIVVHGSGDLIQSLMRENLIDEYRLMVFPIILGKGQRLFPEGSEAKLRLVESKTFSSGVVVLTYGPASGTS